MRIGTIKNVVAARGFGFIHELHGPDHFFHRSDLSDDLDFDELLTERRVRFEVVTTPKGSRAIEIRPMP